MKPSTNEKTTCLLCDYWWIFLLLFLLAATIFLTRGLWGSYIFEPTPMPVPTPGTGDVQVTLSWNGYNDLDLHVVDPEGYEVYFRQTSSPSEGKLDIDSNADCRSNKRLKPIENIYWRTGSAPRGGYQVFVKLYKVCEDQSQTPFSLRLLVDGIVQNYSGSVNSNSNVFQVTEFTR